MSVPDHPVSILVNRDEVPEGGLEVAFVADDAQRAGFARYLGVPRVDSVEARLTASRRSGRTIVVVGRVEARLVQTCVVTLEPIETAVGEDIAVRFVPERAGAPGGGGDEAIAVDDVDIEPFDGDRVDLGALISQTLALAIDPYPRKPGAVFEGLAEPAAEPAADADARSAFADLARLRRKDDGA